MLTDVIFSSSNAHFGAKESGNTSQIPKIPKKWSERSDDQLDDLDFAANQASWGTRTVFKVPSTHAQASHIQMSHAPSTNETGEQEISVGAGHRAEDELTKSVAEGIITEEEQPKVPRIQKIVMWASLIINFLTVVGVMLIVAARIVFDRIKQNLQFDRHPIPALALVGLFALVIIPSFLALYVHWKRSKFSIQVKRPYFNTLERIEDAVFDDRDKFNILPQELDQASKRQLNRLRDDLPPRKHKITHFDIIEAKEEAKYLKKRVFKLKRKQQKKKKEARKKIKEAKNEMRKAKHLGDARSKEIALKWKKKAKKRLRRVKKARKKIRKAKNKVRKQRIKIDVLRCQKLDQESRLCEQVRMQLLDRSERNKEALNAMDRRLKKYFANDNELKDIRNMLVEDKDVLHPTESINEKE